MCVCSSSSSFSSSLNFSFPGPYLVAPAEPAGLARPPFDPGRDQRPVARAVDLFCFEEFSCVVELLLLFLACCLDPLDLFLLSLASSFSFFPLSYLDIVPEGRVFLLGPGSLLGVSVVVRSRSGGMGSKSCLLLSDLLLSDHLFWLVEGVSNRRRRRFRRRD